MRLVITLLSLNKKHLEKVFGLFQIFFSLTGKPAQCFRQLKFTRWTQTRYKQTKERISRFSFKYIVVLRFKKQYRSKIFLTLSRFLQLLRFMENVTITVSNSKE